MDKYYLENLDKIDESNYGKDVDTSGWIEDSRSIGSLIFLTLRNNTGKLQLIIKKNQVSEDLWNKIGNISRQSIVKASGNLVFNKKNNIVELIIKELIILNQAEHPLPLDPTGRVDSGLDIFIPSVTHAFLFIFDCSVFSSSSISDI